MNIPKEVYKTGLKYIPLLEQEQRVDRKEFLLRQCYKPGKLPKTKRERLLYLKNTFVIPVLNQWRVPQGPRGARGLWPPEVMFKGCRFRMKSFNDIHYFLLQNKRCS